MLFLEKFQVSVIKVIHSVDRNCGRSGSSTPFHVCIWTTHWTARPSLAVPSLCSRTLWNNFIQSNSNLVENLAASFLMLKEVLINLLILFFPCVMSFSDSFTRSWQKWGKILDALEQRRSTVFLAVQFQAGWTQTWSGSTSSTTWNTSSSSKSSSRKSTPSTWCIRNGASPSTKTYVQFHGLNLYFFPSFIKYTHGMKKHFERNSS